MALQFPGIVLLVPLGSLILVFFPSSELPMMMVEHPDALAKEPLSPVFASQFDTMVPSGRLLTGKILPTDRAAIK
jgi:hypothetical protein